MIFDEHVPDNLVVFRFFALYCSYLYDLSSPVAYPDQNNVNVDQSNPKYVLGSSKIGC